MDIPVEFIILAAVAVVLILLLMIMLCFVCCRRSQGATEETEMDGMGVAYVPVKEREASVYITPDEEKEDNREASPTVLMDAGYTGTQLVEQGLVREATKTELLDTGFTKSQLRAAEILPEKKEPKKQTTSKDKKADYKKKPLKPFDSNADEDRRTKGKKRAADSDDEAEQDAAVRTKRNRKKTPVDSLADIFPPAERVKSPAVEKRQVVRQKSEEKKKSNARITIKDSNEKIPDRQKKESGKDPGFHPNLTTLF